MSNPTSESPSPSPSESRFQWSGRYVYGGGAGDSVVASDATATPLEPATLHDLAGPIFIDESEAPPAPGALELRFTLHVDVDGTDPLHVVSATVSESTQPATHLIGRVTANDVAASGGRDLVVESFSAVWPGTGERVERLEISLAGGGLATPTATVTFVAASGRRHGPFTATQTSTYFRQIEVEVDREDGAPEAEPYDTHAHPDRPANLPREVLTLESAFAKSGILLSRSAAGNVIDVAEAGDDRRWSERELHDAMRQHWEAFANRPQWKMWIFLAQLAGDDGLGGVMFDGNIDEPGGVDRQGTALFTKSPFFHAPDGGYPQANPPAAEAARRELFFNLIHETGHAFNLAHSFDKTHPIGVAWSAPPWMRLTASSQALSWMNYPDQASPPQGSLKAKYFYDRFCFRFDDNENLFLRHAPERFIQMGNAAWFTNHARVTRGSLDPRLRLVVRARKRVFELGEPVSVELRLGNVSDGVVTVHGGLALHEGFVQLAITNPRGERRPFLPVMHTRCTVKATSLEPQKALYEPIRLTIGTFGSPFKEPGAYRVEASFTNFDGSTAAGVMQLYVRPPANHDDLMTVNELFAARVGSVLYLGGSRVLEDVMDRIDHVCAKLGEKHPAQVHLRAARSLAFGGKFKVVAPGARRVKVLEADPGFVQQTLAPVIADAKSAADTLGHIFFEKMMKSYVSSAVEDGKKAAAKAAQKTVVSIFKDHKVLRSVLQRAEARLKELT